MTWIFKVCCESLFIGLTAKHIDRVWYRDEQEDPHNSKNPADPDPQNLNDPHDPGSNNDPGDQDYPVDPHDTGSNSDPAYPDEVGEINNNTDNDDTDMEDVSDNHDTGQIVSKRV